MSLVLSILNIVMNLWQVYGFCISVLCVFCQGVVPVRAGGGGLVSTRAFYSSSSSHPTTTSLLSAGQVHQHTNALRAYWLGMRAHILYMNSHDGEFVPSDDSIVRLFPRLSCVSSPDSHIAQQLRG